MEPQEFLAAVLPTTGHYCVAQFIDKKNAHTFSSNIDGMLPAIQQHEQDKYCTFFALSSFKEPTSRLVTNVAFIRALFLDLDAYSTKKDAVEALGAFLLATGLPTPWVVSSGNGVHVYWPLLENALVTHWRPVAENLKRLCAQHGLLIDNTVTADAARVLRVPGTHNWKKKNVKPLPCVIRHVPEVTHHALADLAKVILSTLQEPVAEAPAQDELFNIPGKRLALANTPSATAALENRITFFKTILDRTASGGGCGQLAHYMSHAKEDGMEPLWRGMLSIAKACEDGDTASKFLSKLHPYSTSRMNQKLREIKGPYPCTKFDSESPSICPKCPQWGKITNPLAFGHEVQTDNVEKQVEIAPQTHTTPAVTVIRPTPPTGYAYGLKGGIYRQLKEEDTEGNPITTNKLILGYDLFAVDLLKDEDGHHVHLMAMRPEGPTPIIIPQRSVVSKDETVKFLAEKNVLAAYGSGNDKHLFDYVRACAENISAARAAIEVPVSYGWQKDNTFVLNNTVFGPDGEKMIPIPKLANINSITTAGGSFESWAKIWKLVISKKHYDILAMAMIGFGSPLMKFTGFKALTFHLASTDTGTGKTLALQMARSVWGDDRYIMNPHASMVAQEHRAGILGNLPLIIDEITELDEDFKWLASFVMDMTSGTGKERMKSATNEERINTTFWCALMLLASNKHAADFFSGVRVQESRGHLARLLELKMDKKITWTPQEEETVRLLLDNHGHAGRLFAQWLARNHETAARVTREVYKEFRAEVNGVGDERFWVSGCASNIAAAKLLGRDYANIIDIPIAGIKSIYIRMIEAARQNVKANARGAEDILNSYTREFFGQFIVMQINDQTKKMETIYGNSGIVDKTITRTHVKGRVEHDKVPGHVRYYIEESQLRAWCSYRSYGYSTFKEQIEKAFLVTYCKKDMLSGTKGPQMRVNVMQITRPETSVLNDTEETPALPVE